MSLVLRFFTYIVGRGRDKVLDHLADPPKMRRGNERLLTRIKKPATVTTREDFLGGIAALWCTPPNNLFPKKVIYYLHGGGYVVGSCKSYMSLMAKIAFESNVEVVGIDYRLAPEYPFPSGVLDAERGLDHLRSMGYNATDIIIMGDSAGGGLTLNLLTQLKKNKKEMPASVILLSPWADLRNNSTSHQKFADKDCIVHPDVLKKFASYYLSNQTQPDSPFVSSVLADMSGFPPMYIQVGSEEVLLDDAIAVSEKATQDAVDVDLDILPKFPHVFQFGWAYIPEARKAIRYISAYVKKVFTK